VILSSLIYVRREKRGRGRSKGGGSEKKKIEKRCELESKVQKRRRVQKCV
jgi:hypothetical protein